MDQTEAAIGQGNSNNNTDDKWLECARRLNFTDAQYEEAIKEIKSPDNANQLLGALIDISSRDDASSNTHHRVCNQQQQPVDDKTGFSTTPSSSSLTSNSTQAFIHDTTSSYYSSLASFATSSSDQSLESLPPQQYHNQQHQRLHNQTSFPAPRRKIYIDGANVARTHGRNASFSWRGIMLCVRWFVERQFQARVFVAADKLHLADQATLSYLNELGALVECPVGCNDDMFVIEAARQNNGVIVSNDLYRNEKRDKSNDHDLQKFIDQSRLPYVFVDDLFIPASDPLGRTGPTLDEFLRVMPDEHVQHHPFAYRTRSYQRYPKPTMHPTRQYSHSVNGRRKLNTTRSLPVGQTNDTNQQQPIHMHDRFQQYQQNHSSSFDQRQTVHRAACGLYKSRYQRET